MYIDQNLPVDHQVKVEGETLIEEEDFWRRMRTTFDKLKLEAGVDEVVVCTHPSRSQDSLDEISSFCRVVQFEIEKWIRDCELVVTHASTALDFAVIFEKPTCFVRLPEMQESGSFEDMVESYAAKLGCSVNVLSDASSSNLDWGRDKSV